MRALASKFRRMRFVIGKDSKSDLSGMILTFDLVSSTKFIFAPDVPVVRDVMSAVELEFSGDGGTKHTFIVVDGDEALMKMGQVDLCAGVVFVFKPVEWLNRLDEFPQHIHVSVAYR